MARGIVVAKIVVENVVQTIDPSAGNLKYIPAPVISCRCYSFPFHSDNVIVTLRTISIVSRSIHLLFSIFRDKRND